MKVDKQDIAIRFLDPQIDDAEEIKWIAYLVRTNVIPKITWHIVSHPVAIAIWLLGYILFYIWLQNLFVTIIGVSFAYLVLYQLSIKYLIYDDVRKFPDFYCYTEYWHGNDDNELWVMTYKNQPIGTVGIKYKSSDENRELARVAIKKQYRGNGLGEMLSQHVLDYCADNGYKRIIVATSDYHCEAYALYNKLGFKYLLTETFYFIWPIYFMLTYFERNIEPRKMKYV